MTCTSCGNSAPVATFSKPHRRCNKCRARANKASMRTLHYRRFYGLSLDDLESLLESQGRACAICRRSFDDVAFEVDHDHATDKVRGLLCGTCNKFVGWIDSHGHRLDAVRDYLKASEIASA